MWSLVTPSGNVLLLVLDAPSSSFGPWTSLHLIRYDKLSGPPLTETYTGNRCSCCILVHHSVQHRSLKGDDVHLFAHLSFPLNCKHITLKTALETQQMLNWCVNYHYAPLTSLSTLALNWSLCQMAAFCQCHFWGSPYSQVSSSNHNTKQSVNIIGWKDHVKMPLAIKADSSSLCQWKTSYQKLSLAIGWRDRLSAVQSRA